MSGELGWALGNPPPPHMGRHSAAHLTKQGMALGGELDDLEGTEVQALYLKWDILMMFLA